MAQKDTGDILVRWRRRMGGRRVTLSPLCESPPSGERAGVLSDALSEAYSASPRNESDRFAMGGTLDDIVCVCRCDVCGGSTLATAPSPSVLHT